MRVFLSFQITRPLLLTEFAEEVEKIDRNELNKQISEAEKSNDQHKLKELQTKKILLKISFTIKLLNYK